MAELPLRFRTHLLACLLGLSAACDAADKGADGPPAIPGDGADEFLSHVPGQSSDFGAADGDDAVADGEVPSLDPSRAIAEADIIQVQGDRLFALSRYAGLHVIDIADPARLRVLGRYRTNATPFEMYLREGVAYVMFNAYGRYERVGDGYEWRQGSRVEALDVADPGNIRAIGGYDVAGSVSDSRLVGDVLYLVTYEDGYCWGCEQKPNTRVASFGVGEPGEFRLLDQVRFSDEEPYSWGPRSISVNDQRMYVAGPHWDDRDGTLQVVDISDPAGDLVLGAEITIHGSIESRWQMDEHAGVLRVISQPASWRADDVPHVQTFQVESATELVALADLPMVLPRPEELQSVRFDGTRAYAVTFEQTDPLFTFDLSDPAAPEQLGELEIPGFLYHMEPRGDRLYALGFDQGNAEGSLHVSLFDVSDMTAPRMTSRVNFGGDWAHLAEDQDRIHKAFNLALDQGLILVPFGGGSYDDASCHYEYQSGIQLVDVEGDALTLRGVAPQLGEARRALLHRDHLFGVTDNAVQVFDIADRGAPEKIEQVEVARNVSFVRVMGDKLLRFGQDWWTERAMLDFTTLEQAGTVAPLGELDLSELVDDERACSRWSSWSGQVLVRGDNAYVPRYASAYAEDGTYSQKVVLYVLDLRDRSAPRVIGSVETEPTRRDEALGEILLTESALLVGRRSGYYHYFAGEELERPRYHYDIFDLSEPSAPVFATRFEVPSDVAGGGWGYGMEGCGIDMYWGWWSGGNSALVDGDLVVSQHERDVDDGSERVRYYLDRLDVSDPHHPELLPAINIPGQVVQFVGDAERVVTVDYVYREVAAVSWDDCTWRGNRASFDQVSSRCKIYDRRVNVLRLSEDRAVRISQLEIDGERVTRQLAVSDQRLFYLSHTPRDWSEPPSDVRLESLALTSSGALRELPSVGLEGATSWAPLLARGTRAFVDAWGELTVVDTQDESAPKVSRHDLGGWGCSSLEVSADRAFCALGQWGVASFPLE